MLVSLRGMRDIRIDRALLLALAACTADHRLTSPARMSLTDQAAPMILVGAGNIARCDATRDEATAGILDTVAGTVFSTGDAVTATGSLSDFTSCYGPSWGRHKDRTRPAAGDEEYQTSGAAGYFQYFGAAAGDSGRYYYSYDLGAWHIVVLNSNIAMSVGSPQEVWLKSDLAATDRRCVLAYWHHPRFSSSGTTVRAGIKPLWDDLYAAGAEVVVNSHYGVYERFAPQDADEVADPYGVRQFTVGTGGTGSSSFGTARPNSQVRANNTYGVLKLTLADGGYSWQFLPAAGSSFTDAGSEACHDRTPVASVTISPPSGSLAPNDVFQLLAIARDAQDRVLTGRVVTWTSADPAVATVDANGLVRGVALGSATIAVTSEGQHAEFAATVANGPGSAVAFVGAGDIANCSGAGDDSTARLLDTLPGTVFTAGDNAYSSGTAAQYQNCYDPTWGRHKARTKPVAGNHEYGTTAAAGYFGYFGATAGDPATGYYSYDRGSWHLVALNSNLSMSAGTPQEQWLRADLAGTSKRCVLAYWHHPRFSSGQHGNDARSAAVWQALYDAGAEIVLGGHDHSYERFAPQTPSAIADPAHGIREFVVGTGGNSHYAFVAVTANSEVRNAVTFGVLWLTLGADSYAWEFVPTVRGGFTDSGTGSCHDAGPPPNQAPVARPGGPYRAEGAVAFDGSGSSDPDKDLPLSYAWTFGDGTIAAGATPSHAYAGDGLYTVTLTVTDARGASSDPATTTVRIENIAPTVSAGPDATVRPGDVYHLRAGFTDPGDDSPWSYTLDWGDGLADRGTTASKADPITADHAYGTAGIYTIRVTVSDARGGSGADDLVLTVSEPAPAAVLVGAGDIARCDRQRDESTAVVLEGIAGTVFTTGDHVDAAGSLADFTSCYGSSWGRHTARTRPSAGDKDYLTSGASGYFSYFGAAAGEVGKGYYSYELGAWHIVVLNSNIAMSVGSAQQLWLKADLAATTKRCVLAYFHHPRFSSTNNSVRSSVKPLWDALYEAKAEVVLNGHYNVYERFAPQTTDALADPLQGIRQFTVGTGGFAPGSFGTPRPNSEVRNSGTAGVLKLTLSEGGYAWEFVPVAGGTFSDSGADACH